MKKKRLKRGIKYIILFSILFSVLSLGYNLYYEGKYLSNTDELEKLGVLGNFSVNNEENSIPLPKDGNLHLEGHNNVIIKGKFTKDIPENKQVIMRIDNLKVKIFINDNEVYTFGEDTKMRNVKSSGNLWGSFVSPGINTNDDVRIELQNVYTNHVDTAFSSFINNLYVGYESEIILKNLNAKIINIFFTISIIAIGFLAIIQASIMKGIHESVSKIICFGGLCISTGIWSMLDFNLQGYLVPYPIFNNSLDIISLLFSLFFLITYFALYLKSNCKYVLFSCGGVFLATTVIMTFLQVSGIKDYYEGLGYVQNLALIFIPIMVCCIFYEKIKLNNKELNELLFPTIILAIGIMGDIIGYILEINPYMTLFRVSYLIFIIIQFISITKIIRNAIVESAKVEILEEMAYKDVLTGVGNRRAYLNTVDKIEKKRKSVIIMVFDINDLKVVNDKLGHESGDLLIRRSSDVLLKTFKDNSIYRIGGDEFVVILEKESNYKNIICRIQKQIRMNNENYPTDPPVSIAYGVANFNGKEYKSFKEAFKKADKNMYVNKMKSKQIS